MVRLERLINLVAALLAADQPLSADDVHRRVPGYATERGAFRRAFERDKEALREMGVPVVVGPVPGVDPPLDGYRIPRELYYMKDPGLADDELAALHLAASTVRIEGANGMEALWKLGGEVADGGPGTAVAALPGGEHLAVIFAAISGRRRIVMSYRGRSRVVDPHRLQYRGGHWYLAATDVDVGEGRSYRLDRIEGALQPGPDGSALAQAPASSSMPRPWESGDGQPVVAHLWVDAEQAGWAAGHIGPDGVVEQRPDGSVVLEVLVTNRDAFRSFVLGFLDHAELLGPPELRADLTGWLEALCRG